MKNRKAFSLMELLVVIGIIAVLVAILVPMVNRARRAASITAQQLDMQAIVTALENYHSDFGDYPRNPDLARRPVNPALTSAPYPTPMPYLSLVPALLGPGPGVTQYNPTENGDGQYGVGARAKTMNVSVAFDGGVTMTFAPGFQVPQFVSGQSAWWYVSQPGTSSEQVFAITLATVPSPQSNPPTCTVTWSPGGPPLPGGGTGVLQIATGKVWGPYLPADRFKVVFVTSNPTNDPTIAMYIGQPVILDRWGQAMQYFPCYGPADRRYLVDSTYAPTNAPTANTVIAGPLYGFCVPKSIDATSGQNAMYDIRDAGVVLDTNQNVTGGWQVLSPTPTPPTANPTAPNYGLALMWMLGDDDLDDLVDTDSATHNAESLHYNGPYVLMSAGPNGTWCDMSGDLQQILSGNPGNCAADFTASGNIYNFTR